MTSEEEREKLDKILRGVKIPSMPDLLLEAQQELARPEPDPGRVAEVISKDLALSAAVLRTVNSPFFGLRTQVHSVRQAMVLLGIGCVMNLVSGHALRQALAHTQVAMPRFWDTAMEVARLCGSLAHRLSAIPPDEAYTAGLFHNCGIPLLAQRFPNYKDILREANAHPEQELTQVEDRHLATDHAVVGYYVAATWKLPGDMQRLIRHHHELAEFLTEDTPSGRPWETMLCILAIANHTYHLHRGDTQDLEWQRNQDRVLDYLGLSEDDFGDLQSALLDELEAEPA